MQPFVLEKKRNGYVVKKSRGKVIQTHQGSEFEPLPKAVAELLCEDLSFIWVFDGSDNLRESMCYCTLSTCSEVLPGHQFDLLRMVALFKKGGLPWQG